MKALTNVLLRLLGAFQFLTILPIARSTAPPQEAAPFFPLVGGFIGLASSLPFVFLPLSAGFKAALILATQVFLTGMLHEDGLADTADALRAGRSRERMFEILKDSRIGAYGACALGVFLLLRWQGIAGLAQPARNPWQIAGLIAAAEALSRCAVIWLAQATPPAREGMGAWLAEHRSWTTIAATLMQAAGFALLLEPAPALVLLAGLVAILAIARSYFLLRLGGIVGDALGATQQITVVWCLAVCCWPTAR